MKPLYMIATTALTSAFLLVAPVLAEEVDGHGHTKDHGIKVSSPAPDHGTEHGHVAATHFGERKFGSVKEAWAFLTAKVAEGEALLAEGRTETLHEAGEHLGAAIHSLKANAETLTHDGKTRLISALKHLGKAADDLHHATEGLDADATALSLKKIKALLPIVHELHPEGTI